ncbi:hypothetical protein CLCR_00129 [Cladophialophora carrionii]|uniref:AB hydrolase-1 domain-containing protein n=1 Tax=Cladophialophora carrionii TaxID=86049 RepID=A0A1C1C6F0_9EURO|nr:hypothetical protein CLCR_00129 [Cladophialophora carrionii]
MIFLHKSASSSASYEALMQNYATRGYHCYAPDMPGFGGSFDPSESAITDIQREGTAWYAKVFLEAFHIMGIIPQPSSSDGGSVKCHLIGHHSGAVLAVEFAACYPEMVQSMCLVGPTVMSEEERAAMKAIYFAPFNEPVRDGSHLLKTWQYLEHMGVGEDLSLWQREAVDHIRAWRGRTLIYGAVWAQDSEKLYKNAQCPTLLLCARDDVLWKYFGHVSGLGSHLEAAEIAGGNFEPDRDAEGIEKLWTAFLEKI